mmetsp:Transcript_72577/g.115192  ORF Transcript_72577/g.115192 Transcript_72577/m.115192 type:complete len:97 (-) Transcript_72577:466-756(-)
MEAGTVNGNIDGMDGTGTADGIGAVGCIPPGIEDGKTGLTTGTPGTGMGGGGKAGGLTGGGGTGGTGGTGGNGVTGAAALEPPGVGAPVAVPWPSQ